MEAESRTDKLRRWAREWLPRILEVVLTYCEARDRELLVEEIMSAYRHYRARSELTRRAEQCRTYVIIRLDTGPVQRDPAAND